MTPVENEVGGDKENEAGQTGGDFHEGVMPAGTPAPEPEQPEEAEAEAEDETEEDAEEGDAEDETEE